MNWLGGAKKRLRLMGASVNNMDVPNYKRFISISLLLSPIRKNVKLSEGFQNGVLQLPLNNNVEGITIFIMILSLSNRPHIQQILPQGTTDATISPIKGRRTIGEDGD